MTSDDSVSSCMETGALSAREITQGLAGFSSFVPQTVSGMAPCEGSSMHGAFVSNIKIFMNEWASLLTSDAKAVDDTGLAFEGAGCSLSRNFL